MNIVSVIVVVRMLFIPTIRAKFRGHHSKSNTYRAVGQCQDNVYFWCCNARNLRVKNHWIYY